MLYQASFSGRAHLGSALLDRRTHELEQLRRHRMNVTESLDRIERNKRDIEEFFESRLATESTRLTAVISEVKALAQRAGLEPQSIGYPSQAMKDFDLSTRFMVFSVEGSYSQLRRLINFLELSEMFLVIDEISLTGHGNSEKLQINLRVSTTFRGESEALSEEDGLQVQG
jgi:hypothetical protein